MDLRFELTSQFLRRMTIDVAILKKVNPATFILKEMPTLKVSKEFKAFQELEKDIQMHYHSQQCLRQLPNERTLVIVKREDDDKFYRACIMEVENKRLTVLIRVYLVDYGKEYKVTRDKLFQFEKKFLEIPFQAVEFVLLGVRPLSLQIDSTNVTLGLSPAIVWDRSAEEYIDYLLNHIVSVQVETLGIDTRGRVHGNLNVVSENDFGVQESFCLNTYLVKKKYAFKDNILKNVELYTDVNEEPRSSAVSLSSINSLVKNYLFGSKAKFNSIQSDDKELTPESRNKCETIISPSKASEKVLSLSSLTAPDDISLSSALLERKSLSDDLSRKCFPLGRGRLNGVKNLNHNFSPTKSPKDLPFSPSSSQSSPVPVHNVSPISISSERGLGACQLRQPLPFGRGLNLIMNKAKSPEQPSCSPQIENSTTSACSTMEPEMKSIDSDSSGKCLPEQRINGFKKDLNENVDLIAKSLKKCEQLRKLIPLANANVNSYSSNKVLESPVSPSVKDLKTLEETGHSHKETGHSHKETSSKENMDSFDETLKSNLSDGQFSDYESDDESHEKFVNVCGNISSQCFDTTSNKFSKNEPLSNLNISTLGENANETKFTVADGLNLPSHSFESTAIAPDMPPQLNEHKIVPLPGEPILKQVPIESNDLSFTNRQILTVNKTVTSGVEYSIERELIEHEVLPSSMSTLSFNTDSSSVSPGVPEDSSILVNSPISEVSRLSFGRGRGSLLSTSTTTLTQIKGLLSKRKKSISPSKEGHQRENSSPSVSQLSSPIKQSSMNNSEEKITQQQNSNATLSQQKSYRNYDSTEQENVLESHSSTRGNPTSNQSSKDLYAEKIIQDIPIVADLLSDNEEEDPQEQEIVFDHLKSIVNDPNPIIQHLNRTTMQLPCQLLTEYSEDVIKADLDFSDHSLYDDRNSLVVRIGEEMDKQYFSTKEANFDVFIQKRLKDIKFCGPSCIQTALWPMMTKSKAIIAIGPQRSGKTVGYLLPLLSNLINGLEYRKLPKSNGPIMIILCSSWKKVVEVNKQTELFLGECKKVNVLTLCEDGIDEQKKVISLMNGCHVLIATPHYLRKFWDKKALTFNRCCHFIFDDGNDVINYYGSELPPIMDAFVECLGSQVKKSNFIQLILCAEHWTMRLAAFVTKYMFHNTTLLFSSFLEAAVYSKVPMHVHMCEESTKLSQLLKILEGLQGKKITIFSTIFSTALTVHKAVLNAGYRPLYAHEQLFHYQMNSLLQRWYNFESKDENLVMVLTDPALLSINFGDSDYIIHYDLPEVSRLQFSNRFSVIKDCMQSQETNDKPVCHILFTETCETQATSLLAILRRSKSEFSLELKDRATLQKQAIKNLDMPLCDYLKALGSCPVKDCNLRHVINEHLDLPTAVPSQGDIFASIRHVFSPVHFYLKVLGYIDPKTKASISRTAEHASLLIGLQDFFRIHESERRLESNIRMNELYCVQENMEYHRCKVLEVIDEEQQAKVLYIDEGFIKMVNFEQLWSLPDEFSKQPACAVEAYLCKVKPTDPCPNWHPGITKYMFNLISHQKISAKIVLCLGQTLFLDPALIRSERLSFIQSQLNLMNLGQDLKFKAHAIANKEHLELLYKACSGKIVLPEILKTTTKVSAVSQVNANWAFLEMDSIEFVYVNHIESPNKFFVQRDKSADSFDKLLNEIAVRVENETLQHCKTLRAGMFCLAPSPSDASYNRAEILDVEEMSGQTFAHVRFVDYGDYSKVKKLELLVLPPELMLLPFQAIECDLAGVNPLEGSWTESAIDAFYDLTRDLDNPDKQIQLKLKALQKTKRSIGGNIYTVDLEANAGTLSKYLIENGFAKEKEKPWQLDYEPTFTARESDDDDTVDKKDNDESVDKKDNDESVDKKDDDEIPGEKASAALFAAVYLGGINYENINDIRRILCDLPDQQPAAHPEENDQCAQNKSSADNDDDLETIPCELPSDNNNTHSLHPFVTWWNTDKEITVTIHIADVQCYDLEIYETGLKFETVVGQKHYVLEETFYDKILRDEVDPKCLGSYTEFKIKKKVAAEWPRLIQSDQKVFYIKYDPLHLDLEDEELPNVAEVAGPSRINREMMKCDEVVIEEDSQSDSSDSSDDEDQNATPYLKFCNSRMNFDFPS